jgi:uncharacterized protein
MAENKSYNHALELASGENPDYAAAAKFLEKAAEEESAEALSALGSWHFHGRHYPEDRARGVGLWKKACKRGSVDAMLEMGKVYERDEGFKKNLKKAFYYYMQAALAGSGQGCYEISRFFYYGIHVPKDKKVGMIWCNKAAELGYVEED